MKMLRVLLAFCLFCPVILAQDPEVDTLYGTVRGKAITLDDGSVIDTYMAVPFAKPPVGELRFTLSEDPEPWEGVLDASQPGAACVQEIGNTPYNMSEDCLHMNIYSPQGAEELLPVMVYLHGGGYVVGASFKAPGYILARKGVVVVTLNYRLHILGFAYTGDGEIAGNMGLMDQVQGLRFIQENIAAFGGDSNRVTIFGESAGSSSVAQLILIPFAAGLFHGAILESGTEYSGWAYHPPDAQPENFIFDIAQQFECPQFPTNLMVDCLRGVDAYALSLANYTCPPGQNCWIYAFVPVVDGEIIPDLPQNLRDRGEYNMVTEMVGFNEKDGFANLLAFSDIMQNGLTRERYNEIIEDTANHFAEKWPNTTNTQDIIEAYKFFYADWPYYDDILRNRDMFGYWNTDEFFGYPADLQAKLHSRDGNTVYFYLYDYVPEFQVQPDWMGCYHGLDLYTVFGWPFLWLEENEMAFYHSQLTFKRNFTEQDLEYSDFMMTMWTNFAKYGNPTPDEGVSLNGTSIIWPAFTPDELNYIHLQLEPFTAKDLRQDYYAFWTEYLPYLIYDEPITGELSHK